MRRSASSAGLNWMGLAVGLSLASTAIGGAFAQAPAGEAPQTPAPELTPIMDRHVGALKGGNTSWPSPMLPGPGGDLEAFQTARVNAILGSTTIDFSGTLDGPAGFTRPFAGTFPSHIGGRIRYLDGGVAVSIRARGDGAGSIEVIAGALAAGEPRLSQPMQLRSDVTALVPLTGGYSLTLRVDERPPTELERDGYVRVAESTRQNLDQVRRNRAAAEAAAGVPPPVQVLSPLTNSVIREGDARLK